MTVLVLGMGEGVEDVFFLLCCTHSALGIKVFGCSSNSWGRSCPRAYCLDLKHSAQIDGSLFHVIQVSLCHLLYEVNSLHHPFIKLQSSHTYPGISYSSFCCNIFLCTTYPLICYLINYYIEWTAPPHQQEYKLYCSKKFYMFCLLICVQSLAINIQWILVNERIKMRMGGNHCNLKPELVGTRKRMGLPGGAVWRICLPMQWPDSIPESGRSTGEAHGNPLQYSCLGNSMDRGA